MQNNTYLDRRRHLLCVVCGCYIRETKLLNHLTKVHKIPQTGIRDLIQQKGSITSLVVEDFEILVPSIWVTKTGTTRHNSKVIYEREKAKLEKEKASARQRAQEKLEKLTKESSIRRRKLEEQRDRIMLIEGKEYFVIWDDIIFGDDVIKFSRTRIQDLLHPVQYEGVFEKLNTIKKEYFERIHGKKVYKLFFYNSHLVENFSPGWEKLTSCIEQGINFFDYRVIQPPKAYRSPFSKHHFNLTYTDELSRNRYLKLLALHHHEDFPIVPILERRGKVDEKSFIFQARTKRGRIAILWENLNHNRATHAFVIDHANYSEQFEAIQSFITTPMRVKRYLLYLNHPEYIKLKNTLGYRGPIFHTEFAVYKDSVASLLKK